jgi:hypothetical protein
LSNEVKGQPKGPLPARSARADGRGMGMASGYAGLSAWESREEDRFAALLRCVAANIGVALDLWKDSRARAAQRCTTPISRNRHWRTWPRFRAIAIFLLKGCVCYCENDKSSRRWRDLANGFRTTRRKELPKELAADAAEFQLGLPSAGDCCRE